MEQVTATVNVPEPVINNQLHINLNNAIIEQYQADFPMIKIPNNNDSNLSNFCQTTGTSGLAGPFSEVNVYLDRIDLPQSKINRIVIGTAMSSLNNAYLNEFLQGPGGNENYSNNESIVRIEKLANGNIEFYFTVSQPGSNGGNIPVYTNLKYHKFSYAASNYSNSNYMVSFYSNNDLVMTSNLYKNQSEYFGRVTINPNQIELEGLSWPS
ncbi:hypothetical protein PIROE2DRAFT_10608 [Piromyces sp. E2]|nr:hypothetical protein PIROE2DRAFT_10608 [Piromyces sp. E2]|eukprot:OUM62975.1 hypothetical protein PIROE2DRAFT_10608 [Piromyces sp. E2]